MRKIDADGQLTNEPFQFNISSDHQECQAHYENLGGAVTDHIYQLLEKKNDLLKLQVPKGSEENGTFVYATKDYNKQSTLMVLIQGSGAVRAGQWARS